MLVEFKFKKLQVGNVLKSSWERVSKGRGLISDTRVMLLSFISLGSKTVFVFRSE